MRRFHLALSVVDVADSVRDYSVRLGCEPALVVADEYALWRTESLNFSIRKVADAQAGTLRHLGWEDESAAAFTSSIDGNGIVWERFTEAQQLDEIKSLWPHASSRGGAAHVTKTMASAAERRSRTSASDSLAQVRDHIDHIDREMVTLLADRARLVREAAQFKSSADAVRAPDRVEQVVANVKAIAAGLGADPQLVEEVYRTMIAKLIEMELREHASSEALKLPPTAKT